MENSASLIRLFNDGWKSAARFTSTQLITVKNWARRISLLTPSPKPSISPGTARELKFKLVLIQKL